jgi:hypothetical protein
VSVLVHMSQELCDSTGLSLFCKPSGLFMMMQLLIIFVTCQLFIMLVIILVVDYVDDSASC